MKYLKTVLPFTLGIIAVLMLHTAQLQLSENAARISWIIIGGLVAYMIHPEKSVLFVIISAAIAEAQSGLPYGVQLFAMLSAMTFMHLSFQRLFKTEAMHTYVVNGVIWTILFNAFLFLCVLLGRTTGLVELSGLRYTDMLIPAAWQIGTHAVIIGIVFIGFSFFKQNFVRTQKDDIIYG